LHYYWRRRAKILRKDSTISPNSGHTFVRPISALIVDFALAPARQKFKKVKLFLRFFENNLKRKKSANLLFCGFLVFSVFHVEHLQMRMVLI
jgi:hypothetical protein